jgi:hypothetical protein
MTLPGFNAETLLYKTSIDYHSMGAPYQADSLVLPQFDPCGCRRRCCLSGVCHTHSELSCFLYCITFCDE